MQPDCLVNQCGNFELDSMFDRQPVEWLKMTGNRIAQPCTDNCPCSSVLNSLQSDDVALRCAPEKGITIIEACVDDGASNIVGTFCVNRASYMFEGPDVVEWICAHILDMWSIIKSMIKWNTQQFDFIDRFNVDSSHIQNVDPSLCTLLPYIIIMQVPIKMWPTFTRLDSWLYSSNFQGVV